MRKGRFPYLLWALCSAQKPAMTHIDPSASYDDLPDPLGEVPVVEPEVNPGFIDALGQSMGFSEADEEYRKGLHAFPKVCLYAHHIVSTLTLVS